jgi:hypothetical protein
VNCYPFIEAEKQGSRNVKRACELLKVSRAAYYAARCGQPCDRDRQDAELTTRIRAEHKRSRGRYGAPRSPIWPVTARSPCRSGARASAGTTLWPSRSSPR